MANVIINDTNLTNIANAIREKNGTSETYKPNQMAAAILAIQGGGGDIAIPEGDYINVLSGEYWNYQGAWDWLLNQNSHISFWVGDGYYTSFMFGSNATDISNVIILGGAPTSFNQAFRDCKSLTNMPEFRFTNRGSLSDLNQAFYWCMNLSRLPEDMWMHKNVDGTMNTSYSIFDYRGVSLQQAFYHCYKLRNIPKWSYSSDAVTYLTATNAAFGDCYLLDELVDFPATSYTEKYSDMFYNAFNGCHHLKRLTFQTNADGTPIKNNNWHNQTIDLSVRVGYSGAMGPDCFIDAGLDRITYEVSGSNDLSKIEAYPDDWWAMNADYSRYNHDSAVETINSLPDCSACTGNTIKFRANTGYSDTTYGSVVGSGLGKAIQDLTEEEIAVAAAKGWTVTLV